MTRRDLLLMSGSLSPALLHRARAQGRAAGSDYPLKATPLTQVDVADEFWTPRIEANRNVSIWHCFDRLKGDGDFGLSKLLEGATYMAVKQPDPKLERYASQRIDAMLAAMEPRLSDPTRALRVSGHFYEAASAAYRLTGNRKMFDAGQRAFESISSAYGPGKKVYISEHEGQKIGLVAMYRATGDARYWKLAQFFLDQRGREDYPRRGEYAKDRTYAQDHEPVIHQTEAVGHCVRAMFLYIALADIAALTADRTYSQALDHLWQDATFRKMYLTGGIGSIRFHEQFGAPYELPNLSAWHETCASYGNAVWNHRMFLLRGDAQYLDVMERVLYNGVLGGVALEGGRFFYQTPLKSFGNYERFEWINTPCCPPNVVRMLASLGNYIYAEGPGAVYVNLFVAGKARVNNVGITQETRYPWDGDIAITVRPEQTRSFALFVRIPGWAQNHAVPGLYDFADRATGEPEISVNGKRLRLQTQRGFVKIEREWKAGDRVELRLPMPVRQIHMNESAKEDRGRVALQRGPLVYCAEWPDNGGHALNVILPESAKLRAEKRPELCGGVTAITGEVRAMERADDGATTREKPHPLTAIPYFAWANRGMGEMQVWMPRTPAQAWIAPVPPEPIARVTAAGAFAKAWTGYNDQNDDLRAVYDGVEPISSADESSLFRRLRPEPGQMAAIEYTLKRPTRISTARVYFFDDRRFCRMPASWRIVYNDGGEWKPVQMNGAYEIRKDQFNEVHFEPVMAVAVRLEIEPLTVQYKSGDIGPPDAMFINKDLEWREAGVIEWRIA